MRLMAEDDRVRAHKTHETGSSDSADRGAGDDESQALRSSACECEDCPDLARDEMWTRWA